MKENFESDSKDDSTKDDSTKKNRKNKKLKTEEDNEIILTDVEQEYLDLVETKKTLQSQLDKRPNSKVLKKK